MFLCCLFFFQIFLWVYNFFIFAHTYQGTYQSFIFNFRFFSRKSQSQQKQPKRITHFIIQFRLKNLTHFMNLNLLDIENNMLPQYSQKLFWLYYKFSSKHVSVWSQKKRLHSTISWRPKLNSWSTLKANVRIFLHISVTNFFFQRHSTVLCDGEWLEGSWIISLMQLVVWVFRNSTIFQHFDTCI